jgi:hypothetical protein
MSDVERIWREKSDEDLLEAAAQLGDFTEEGQQVIRAELKRRGLEDPVEQATDAKADAANAEAEEPEGPSLPEPECTRCHAEMRYRGTRTLLGEVGNLFANSDTFDLYVCPKCGHVDLFTNEIGAESAGE